MPDIFQYSDARKFLKDLLEEKKKENRQFSHRAVLQKMGVSSTGFLANVLSGRKNLTPEQVLKLGPILKLKAAESRYFECLVLFTQAKSLEDRNTQLKRLVANQKVETRALSKKQLNLFSKWHYVVLREMLYFHRLKEDYRTAGRMLMPPIASEEVEKAVKELEELDFIEKDAEGVVSAKGRGGHHRQRDPIPAGRQFPDGDHGTGQGRLGQAAHGGAGHLLHDRDPFHGKLRPGQIRNPGLPQAAVRHRRGRSELGSGVPMQYPVLSRDQKGGNGMKPRAAASRLPYLHLDPVRVPAGFLPFFRRTHRGKLHRSRQRRRQAVLGRREARVGRIGVLGRAGIPAGYPGPGGLRRRGRQVLPHHHGDGRLPVQARVSGIVPRHGRGLFRGRFRGFHSCASGERHGLHPGGDETPWGHQRHRQDCGPSRYHERFQCLDQPRGTLRHPPLADGAGAFKLDSLPEGVYELVPQCFSCRPVSEGHRVRVKAGEVTVLDDTLKLYPEYFFGFPDSGDLFIRSSWLPVPVGGKLNRGDEDRMHPASVAWTWNGNAVRGTDVPSPEGISETSVLVDSSWFAKDASGILKLVLSYPDTSIAREWRVAVDTADRIWPLSAVAVTGAVRIPGPVDRSVWRFRVTDSRPLDPAAAAYWNLGNLGNLSSGTAPIAASLPQWIDLEAVEAELVAMGGLDTARFTFFLVPDSLNGGRVFRPRRDERLEDIPRIRYLQGARLPFTDSLEPSMLPEGLFVDRRRGPNGSQRYRIDSAGGVEELLGELSPSGLPVPVSWPAAAGAPLLFYRSGPASAGYSWKNPLRDAARILAVTRNGMAMRLDGSSVSIRVSGEELESLKALLEPLAQAAPALADTGSPAAAGELEYAFTQGRGLLWNSGTRPAADGLSSGIRGWMVRNGLDESARFPLAAGTFTWLGFETDASGWRYTGDTLVAVFADSAGGAVVTERLSAGSPGRAADSAAFSYFLKVAGDSLTAMADPSTASRLFGNIGVSRGVFALIGLETVSPAITDGVPVLRSGGNTLSGRLVESLEIAGRQVAGPAVFLDGRAIDSGKQGQGFLYTPEGGLERTWRFGGKKDFVAGWDRR